MKLRRLAVLPVIAAAVVSCMAWAGGSDAAAPAAGWSLAPSALPRDATHGADDAIGGVACWSAGGCALAGTYQGASGTEGVLRTTGAVHRTSPAPLPADAASDPQLSLGDLACSAPGACVAVGSYRAKDGGAHPLAETLANGAWTPSAPALPADGRPSRAVLLDQVSCSAAVCTAVGSYAGVAPDFAPLVLVRSAGHWRAAAVTAPSSPVVISGVSCPPAGRCAAYGTVAGRSAVFRPTDGSWRGTYAPAPKGARASSLELTSISCPGAGSCVVLGSYAAGTGRGVVAETVSDTTVTAVRVPLPAQLTGRSVRTAAVACPTSTACVGVGVVTGFHTSTSGGAVLVQRRGTVWSAQLVPLPGTALQGAYAYLQDVACSSPTACTAVGGYDRTRVGGRVLERPLVDTWDGTRWSVQGLGRPAALTGDVSDGLFQVSCRGGHCLAAGTFEQYARDGSVRDLGGFTADRP